MTQQKKSLITRLIEGKEKSEEYARSTLPTNRWQLFWDIFKGNFGKMVKVNLLTLIFFIPLIAVVIFYLMLVESNGIIYPFGANLGVGYPAAPMQQGVAELLAVQNSFVLYIGLILTGIIAAIGLSGGMYVVRNMVWTEGIFVTNDFWRGIKLNYKNALQTVLIFTAVLLLAGSMVQFAEFSIVVESLTGFRLVMMRISQATSYVLIAVAAMLCFWMIALGVNYKLTLFAMLRNALLITIATVPQTLFFILLALLPFVCFLLGGTLFLTIGIVAVALFALSYALLVWLDFAQWLFDKYINPKVKGARVGRGIYSSDGSSPVAGVDSGAGIEYQKALLAHGKSRLIARPIKPIDDSLQVYELPGAFTREDLKRLRESKQNIAEDTEKYAEEHKNDLRYVEYNKQFEEREKALQDEVDSKGRKKKRKPPKLLGE